MIRDCELEALELLVKSGNVSPQIDWRLAIPDIVKYIIDLAKRLEADG